MFDLLFLIAAIHIYVYMIAHIQYIRYFTIFQIFEFIIILILKINNSLPSRTSSIEIKYISIGDNLEKENI
jgi:hypothetical protein